MISLAHSIAKRVVVEGVETKQQLDVLQKIGADEIQGFLLGRPSAPEGRSLIPTLSPIASDPVEAPV